MPDATTFTLPIPLDVEPLLEALLGDRRMALPFRARSSAAGEAVAALIREAHAKMPVRRPARPVAAQRPPEPEDDDVPPAGLSKTDARIAREAAALRARAQAAAGKGRAGR